MDNTTEYLEEAARSEASSSSPTAAFSDLVSSNDAEIIRGTLRVYGSLYGGFFLLFCFLRQRFPKHYNVRSWVPEMQCDLAITQSYGFFSWAWRVFLVSDDELLENVGMDALCFLRALRMGAKLSLCGVFNSIWLIPMFLTAQDSPETAYLSDKFAKMSVANLPSGSPRFAGIVLAAYITLFYSFRLITDEFDWFITYRHKFLSQRIPRNYTIYVAGIPEHLRSDFALADFFRNNSLSSAVLEAHMAMDIPSLEASVARRFKVVELLEHAMALEKKKGIIKTHTKFLNLKNATRTGKMAEKVGSVEAYREELMKLNNDISLEIGRITNKNNRMRQHLTKMPPSSNIVRLSAVDLAVSPKANEELEITIEFQERSSDSFASVKDSSSTLLEPTTNVAHHASHQWGDYEMGTETIEGRDFSQRQDSTPHPFLQLLGMENILIDRQGNTNESSGKSSLTSPGLDGPIQPPQAEGRNHEPAARQDIFIEGADESNTTGALDIAGSNNDAKDHYKEIAAANTDEQTTVLENQVFTNTNEDEAKNEIMEFVQEKSQPPTASTLGSEASTKKSGFKLKRFSSVSAAQFTSTPRNNVTVENMSGGVKKAGNLGVSSAKKAVNLGVSGAKKAANLGVSGAKRAANVGVQKLQMAPELANRVVDAAAAVAPVRMLRSNNEETPREAGFVIFKDLYTAQAALQMLQNPSEKRMVVEPAPSATEIFWRNVGLPGKARKTGALLSLAATATLCFFWSIPMAFFSSLTEINSIKEKLPLLAEWIEAFPALETALALLAPLLLLALNEGILPNILKWFSTWEGLVGAPQVEASTFVKLSTFVIIQTFFVSAISGSITAEIANIIDNPEKIVELLANSLPTQSSYFIQIVMVFTFMGVGLELLRVKQLALAFLRGFIGPNLTAKERRKSWKFLQSLEDPLEFFHAEVFSQIILSFVVFFVYAQIAPITCIFLCGSFLICESSYRYHFIHNHKTRPDSGGRLWRGFIQVLMASMLIGQLTLIGCLILKNAVYAVPALAPMLVMTILFMALTGPKKLKVSDSLPTIMCMELDRNFSRENTSFDFLKGQYQQPALNHRRIYPDEHFD